MNLSRRKFLKLTAITGTGIGIGTLGIFEFLNNCTRVREDQKFIVDDLVDHAFRLTDHNSLLNLEYYFINCNYEIKKEKITAKYGPHENYMVVRLPQQHIAEQNFPEKNNNDEPTKDFRAATNISSYSYLVFRILFPTDPIISRNDSTRSRLNTLEDGERTDIKLREVLKIRFFNFSSSRFSDQTVI